MVTTLTFLASLTSFPNSNYIFIKFSNKEKVSSSPVNLWTKQRVVQLYMGSIWISRGKDGYIFLSVKQKLPNLDLPYNYEYVNKKSFYELKELEVETCITLMVTFFFKKMAIFYIGEQHAQWIAIMILQLPPQVR